MTKPTQRLMALEEMMTVLVSSAGKPFAPWGPHGRRGYIRVAARCQSIQRLRPINDRCRRWPSGHNRASLGAVPEPRRAGKGWTGGGEGTMSIQLNQVIDIATITMNVRRVVSEELGVELQNIKSDTDVVGELDAGQSDMESIKIAIEYWFHIKISEENWKKMKQIHDIVHLVDVYLEIKQIEM
ncbi:MAG: acyl carrier protein [Rhodospirillaceae bacterium]